MKPQSDWRVWEMLLTILYEKTMTYGEIAGKTAAGRI